MTALQEKMKIYSTCRVTIGSKAVKIKNPTSEITHEWSAYVKAPKDIVKCVHWKLHESFTNNMVVTEYPFEIKEKGWGEFVMQIKIVLLNDDRVNCSHLLKLHGEESIVISETHDELVFRGAANPQKPTEEEEEEFKKIDNGINHMLMLFKEMEY